MRQFQLTQLCLRLLGCILAELYTGFAILPGEDESDQLACIIELLGMPSKQVLGEHADIIKFNILPSRYFMTNLFRAISF
jgi:hypothetical protein